MPVPHADRTELAELVNLYARSCDRRDRESFRSLWWHGATLEVHRDGPDRSATSVLRAPDDLDHVIDRLSRHHRTLHVVTNHTVDASDDDDDLVIGEAVCAAHHLRLLEPGDAEGPANDHLMMIRYADRYRRVNHHWRFEHRSVNLLWTADVRVTATP